MTGKALFLLTVSLLVAGSLSSDSCSTIVATGGDDDFNDDNSDSPPPSGGVLPAPAPGDDTVNSICPALKGQSQCCSGSYFNDAKNKLKSQSLKDGLKIQAQPRIRIFRELASSVNQYYMSTLNNDITINFDNRVTPNATTLNLNPAKDKFNPSTVVNQILSGLIQEIKKSAVNKTCVELQGQATLADQSVALDTFAKDIASLRNASTLLYLIDQYLLNMTDNLLATVPPTDQCAKILLGLTCAKCKGSIGKLCGSFCSAATKGCFAPYFAALNPQFDILWDVTRQLVTFLNQMTTEMFDQQRIIRQALINNWNAKCNTSLSTALNGNTRPQGVDVDLLQKAQRLLKSGLLSYNGTVASLCSAKTSKSKCWNGKESLNNDGPEFSVDSIRGQAKNPAGAFDETELTQQAQTIGTPINNFFSTPNVSMVTPSAIIIPQGQVYTGAATTLSISLLLVLALALLISA
ncbi:hypothetical protein EMCRGX_G030048 [Ephydatia muelleri]|eukprot:Em0010g255a